MWSFLLWISRTLETHEFSPPGGTRSVCLSVPLASPSLILSPSPLSQSLYSGSIWIQHTRGSLVRLSVFQLPLPVPLFPLAGTKQYNKGSITENRNINISGFLQGIAFLKLIKVINNSHVHSAINTGEAALRQPLSGNPDTNISVCMFQPRNNGSADN